MIRSILVVLALTCTTLAIMPREKAFDFSAQAVMPDLSFKTIKLSDY